MDYEALLHVYVWIASIVGTLALCLGTGALFIYGLVRYLVKRAAAKSVETMIKIAAMKAEMVRDDSKAVH